GFHRRERRGRRGRREKKISSANFANSAVNLASLFRLAENLRVVFGEPELSVFILDEESVRIDRPEGVSFFLRNDRSHDFTRILVDQRLADMKTPHLIAIPPSEKANTRQKHNQQRNA